MAAFCLTKQASERLKRAFKNGEINPEKIASISSAERRAILEKYVGKENSVQVNALFESKLLLKNRKAGYISWAKKVTGITQEVRRDILSKIERLDKVLDPKDEQVFLEDLVKTRLGVNMTEVEAKTLASLSKQVEDLRLKADENYKFPTEKDRLKYGLAKAKIEDYFNELKLKTKSISFREQPLRKITSTINEIPGSLKSVVASLDNSFFGRQGIKALYTHPITWIRNFGKSWVDIAKELKGSDAMFAIKADIYSRPNALNGKYRIGGYGLDALSEEAYPSSLPEKIPLFKRLFKASESAYNGAALRMRADLADMLIKKAEEQGVNTLNPEEARGLGSLISSMTGRGNLGVFEPGAQKINTYLFSVKFIKSNFDTLTLHLLDKKANSFVKKEAALNMLKMVASLGAVLTIAKVLDPNSVDEDPRSSNFGKIKIFGHWTDITGGMASMVTLASRTIIPTVHNGKLSLWQKSSSGGYTDLLAGNYGQTDAWDLILDGLISNKLSPIAGAFRDRLRGQTFQGEKSSFSTLLKNATTPLSIQQFNSLMQDPNSSSVLGSMILEGLGFNVNTSNRQKDWSLNPTKEQKAFLDKVGKEKFDIANSQFNERYNNWYNKTAGSESFKKLPDEAKTNLIKKAKENIQTTIFKEYKFKYKAAKKTKEQKAEGKTIKNLLP